MVNFQPNSRWQCLGKRSYKLGKLTSEIRELPNFVGANGSANGSWPPIWTKKAYRWWQPEIRQTHQLRLVVYPIVHELFKSQVVQDFFHQPYFQVTLGFPFPHPPKSCRHDLFGGFDGRFAKLVSDRFRIWGVKKGIGRWLNQPLWKILVKLGIFPKVREENHKIFELPPPRVPLNPSFFYFPDVLASQEQFFVVALSHVAGETPL